MTTGAGWLSAVLARTFYLRMSDGARSSVVPSCRRRHAWPWMRPWPETGAGFGPASRPAQGSEFRGRSALPARIRARTRVWGPLRNPSPDGATRLPARSAMMGRALRARLSGRWCRSRGGKPYGERGANLVGAFMIHVYRGRARTLACCRCKPQSWQLFPRGCSVP